MMTLAWCVAFALSSSGQTVQVGESSAEVIQRLGKPQGRMATAQRETLFYAKGSVDLTNGLVSAVRLSTPGEIKRESDRLQGGGYGDPGSGREAAQ
ncbi:MAG: hypothetical protein O2901_15050 [Verrucomicrobia bacterium]|nr:hypothetical protein [Verrucomicrobiota bacterium]